MKGSTSSETTSTKNFVPRTSAAPLPQKKLPPPVPLVPPAAQPAQSRTSGFFMPPNTTRESESNSNFTNPFFNKPALSPSISSEAHVSRLQSIINQSTSSGNTLPEIQSHPVAEPSHEGPLSPSHPRISTTALSPRIELEEEEEQVELLQISAPLVPATTTTNTTTRRASQYRQQTSPRKSVHTAATNTSTREERKTISDEVEMQHAPRSSMVRMSIAKKVDQENENPVRWKEWTRYYNSEGVPYYFNHDNQITTWEKPVGFALPPPIPKRKPPPNFPTKSTETGYPLVTSTSTTPLIEEARAIEYIDPTVLMQQNFDRIGDEDLGLFIY